MRRSCVTGRTCLTKSTRGVTGDETVFASCTVATTTVNGGVMNAKGYGFGLTTIPFQSKNAQWTSRANWFHHKAEIVSFPDSVKPFRENTAAALADFNIVRTISGKLAPLAALPTGAAGLDLIMYEKHKSLRYDGVRWVDMRRWERLGQLPID
jgi:hypothetical protein